MAMAELRFPVRDKATKPIRDMLKRQGLKLVEVRRYAVVREDDGPELCSGTLDDVFKWSARHMRERP
jgi:hypothetical protein